MPGDRTHARQLAKDFIEKGDPVGWFEPLYAHADGDERRVPWADLVVNPHLKTWLAGRRLSGERRKAIVIGCGLGDDAEELARLGFQVVAFDVSPTAIAWCRQRFPNSPVEY